MRPERGGAPTGAELVALGILLAAMVVVPLAAGIAVDGVLHTGPWGAAVGLLLGIAASVAGVYTRFRRYL